jgi:NAD(P)H-nitrite reductase large subunit
MIHEFPSKNKNLFTEDILMAPLTEVVCYCSNVTKGRITAAIQEGAKSLEDIKIVTGACAVGKCKELSPRKR